MKILKEVKIGKKIVALVRDNALYIDGVQMSFYSLKWKSVRGLFENNFTSVQHFKLSQALCLLNKFKSDYDKSVGILDITGKSAW